MNLVGGRRFSPLTAVDLPRVAEALTGFLHGAVNLLVTYHGNLSGVTLWRGQFTVTVRQDDWAKIAPHTMGEWSRLNNPYARPFLSPPRGTLSFRDLDPTLYQRILTTLQGLLPLPRCHRERTATAP